MISMQDFLQTIVNSLPTIGRYALVTIGIVLIFRTTATTNFAQGLIATFGTFVVTWASLTYTALPLWVCLLLGMAAAFEQGDAAAALAFARELPPYRSHAEIELLDLFPLHSYLWDLGLRRDALAYFRRLVQAHPGRGDLLNNVAWLLSTSEWSPAPPQEAVELAQRAQALAPAPHPVLLDTWAVAHANAGDFEKAIQATRQALELTPETPPNAAFRRNLQARIKRYRLSQPYREEAATRLW